MAAMMLMLIKFNNETCILYKKHFTLPVASIVYQQSFVFILLLAMGLVDTSQNATVSKNAD